MAQSQLFVVLAIQSFAQRVRYRNMVKNLVYSAMDKAN